MKVILNQDVKHLGEEGDVKTVANGYARNYLFPRNFALPYNEVTVAYFEGRKAEIEARKDAKRKDSASLKEKLEAEVITIVMPAGANGKLYGAVTNQAVVDYLQKKSIEIERKRIDIPGSTIKNTGKYTISVRLYESAVAEITLVVKSQEQADKEAAESAAAKASAAADAKEESAEAKAE